MNCRGTLGTFFLRTVAILTVIIWQTNMIQIRMWFPYHYGNNAVS